MARPKSEDKQLALLDAAAEIVAVQGLAAPTAQIARQAGVAEGTLFRYFATKDDLLNALYLHLKSDLSEAVKSSFTDAASPELQAQSVWNSYIDWGLLKPVACRAVNQLAVSDKIRPETREAVKQLFPEVRCAFASSNTFNGLSAEQSSTFADAILVALAQVAMTFAANTPDQAEAYKAAGFAAMRRTLSGE